MADWRQVVTEDRVTNSPGKVHQGKIKKCSLWNMAASLSLCSFSNWFASTSKINRVPLPHNYSLWIHLWKVKATSLTFQPPYSLAQGEGSLLSHFNNFHLANEGLFSLCPEAHLFVLLHFITRLNVNWVFHIICAELMSHSKDFSQISCKGLCRCCNSTLSAGLCA